MTSGVWVAGVARRVMLRGVYLWEISAAPFFDLRLGDEAAQKNLERSRALLDGAPRK